jgi:hypothetical protein
VYSLRDSGDDFSELNTPSAQDEVAARIAATLRYE